MSYILDALRRAENERERDRHQVPDLHAAHAPLPQAADAWARANQGASAGPSRQWLAGILVLVLAAGAAAGYWFWGGTAHRQPNKGDAAAGARAAAQGLEDRAGAGLNAGGSLASARGAAPAAVPPGMVAQIDGPPVPAKAAAEANARAMEAAALPAPNTDKPLTAPAPRSAREPARDPARVPGIEPGSAGAGESPAAGAGAVPGAGAAAATAPDANSAARPSAVTPAGRAAGAGTPPAAAVPAPVLPLNSLAPELRSQIPPMVVGGAIYSDRPANRFVLINGQVVREGESAATGVTLERIGPKSAVMRWRDMRFEMPL
jgi:general secretion pathway protein B